MPRQTRLSKAHLQINQDRHLLSLPPEIRVSIYRLLVVQLQQPMRPNVDTLFKSAAALENGTADPARAPGTVLVLALAGTCKQIHDEVVSVYYAENRFEFIDTYALYQYLYMIGWERREYIRSLEIWWHGACQGEAFKLLGECTGLKTLTLNVFSLTTKSTKRPQTDLWRARGTKELQRIRGLEGLSLRVRECPHERRKHFGSTSNPRFFAQQHVLDFEKSLGEKMRNERTEEEGEDEDELQELEVEAEKYNEYKRQQEVKWNEAVNKNHPTRTRDPRPERGCRKGK